MVDWILETNREMPYYRRNIYVLSITIFLAAVSWQQIIPFLPQFIGELGAGRDIFKWIAIVFAAQSVASMLAQPLWGKMADTYGRKPMIIRAGLFLTGIYFAMSLCTVPWHLALLRFLNGALTGFIPGSYALVATNTPQELAPRAVATAQSASAAGLIVGPALGGFLASTLGYRGSMRVSGAAVLISTLLVWWLVKEPNKADEIEKTSLIQDVRISLRSPVQLSIIFAVMMAWFFGYSINPYLTLHLSKLSGDPPKWLIGAVYSIPAVAFVFSARYWTRLGESWGYHRTILAGLIGGGIGAVSLVFARNVWTFSWLYLLTGIWLAAIMPSAGALTCTRVDESFRGRAYGIQNSAGWAGALLAPVMASNMAAAYGIRSIFALVAGVFVLAAFVFRYLVGRWKSLM
ncbi:MAG: MFS transporter [Armatimonadetes bacterium]|nr:MFS transporter [Armatimonadota bacterium]